MSQNAGALTPARGNRRFILLAMVLGLMGAGLVYVAASSGGSSSSSGGGSAADTAVVVAKQDIPARSAITNSMVEVKLVPEDDRNVLGYGAITDVIGKVTRYPLVAGEQVLSTKIVALDDTSTAKSRSLSFVIPEGKRGIAITTSQVEGAGGLVLPGDYVDVLVMYDVEFTTADGSKEKVPSFLVQTLMQNIEVLSVSQVVVDTVESPSGTTTAASATTPAAPPASKTPTAADDTTQRVRNSEASPQPDAKTVTLALTPQQAQTIFLAEGNGTIRLAVRPYGEGENLPIDYQTQVDLLPKNIPNPFTR
jgi:pilus assembly protein CpaB